MRNFWIRNRLVEPDRLKISTDGQETTVKPRSMAVLVELVRADGGVVSRRDLLNKVWKGADVSDDVLTQCVADLRRAFGDDAHNPRFVETVKRVGIRLIPPATPERPTKPIRRSTRWMAVAAAAVAFAIVAAWLIWHTETMPQPAAASIAVLPFAKMHQDADGDYFVDGLTEEIISSLAAVPDIKVSARTSSFAYKGRDLDIRLIGERLNVANVLEGSVRRSGNRLRVTAQLIEVKNGYHRWSRSYDHELGDAVEIQQEIAADVVAALAPQFGYEPIAPTSDGHAYDLFLAGKQHLRAARYDTATRLFAEAVARDPGFALAHANLAIAVTSFSENATVVRQVEGQSRTPLDVAQEALIIASRAGLRHTDRYLAEASIAALLGDLDAEAQALERAIEQNSVSVTARIRLSENLAARGQYRQALQQLEAVQSVDPLNAGLVSRQAVLVALFSGYGAGQKILQRQVELDLASPIIWAAMTELAAEYGRYDDRVDYALQWVMSAPNDASAMSELGDAYTELGEFEIADEWISAAEQLSWTAALKARCRWFGARGDWASLGKLVEVAAEEIGLLSVSTPATPAQSAVTGLLGLNRANAGDHDLAAQLFERVAAASPTLPRRSPHMRVYVKMLLAEEYSALGDQLRKGEMLDAAQEQLDAFQEAGITNHPWLSLLQASVHALRDDEERARQSFNEAIDQGWRAWLLEQYGVARPLGDVDSSIQRLLQQLANERQRVRGAGMFKRPKEMQ